MNVNLFGCLSEIFLEHDHIFKSDFIIFTTIEALSSSIVVPSPRSSTIKIRGNFIFVTIFFLDRIGSSVFQRGTCRGKLFQPQMFLLPFPPLPRF